MKNKEEKNKIKKSTEVDKYRRTDFHLKDGVRHGPYISYFLPQTPSSREDREEGSYVNGKKEGLFTRYFFDGEKLVGTYKNGFITGPYVKIYPFGSMIMGCFKNGLEEGFHVSFNSDGSRHEYFIKNGKREGVSKDYDEDGNLTCEDVWIDNSSDGSQRKFHKNID